MRRSPGDPWPQAQPTLSLPASPRAQGWGAAPLRSGREKNRAKRGQKERERAQKSARHLNSAWDGCCDEAWALLDVAADTSKRADGAWSRGLCSVATCCPCQ